MSQRYKREIEEILRRSSDLPDDSVKRDREGGLWKLTWTCGARILGGRNWSISPNRIMLIASCLLLVALLLRASTLAWVGLFLFIVGYGSFFIRPSKVDKYWRGQVVDGSQPWWRRFASKRK